MPSWLGDAMNAPYEGLPSGEWSLPYSGEAPAALAQEIERTFRLTRGLAPRANGAEMAVPDRPRVVTILGDRGMGKSTVLRFALRMLRTEPSCVVLPVIDPESFAIGDSLAGWVLAQLEQEIEAEAGVAWREKHLGVHLQELARNLAVRGSAFLPGLEQRGLTFEDFGRDAVKLPRRGVHIGSDWASLLDGIAEARGERFMQLVLAVDDADLAPDLLPSIVRDAQLLGASPRTALIFAAHRSTLRRSLEIGLLTSYGSAGATALEQGLLTAAELRDTVDRRFVKSFPRSLRVELEALEFDERLRFTPLGEAQPIIDVLRRFSMTDVGYASLADIFEIRSESGAVLGPSGYSGVLSENARDLRQLHEALTEIDPDSGEAAAARALTMILRHGLEASRGQLPSERPQLLQFGVNEHGLSTVSFDLRDINFGTTTGHGHVIYREDRDEDRALHARIILARVFIEFYAYDAMGADRELTRANKLPDQIACLLYLAWESAQDRQDGALLPLARLNRGVVAPGGATWARQVTDGRDETKWTYWTVPDWETFSDYFVFHWGWEKLHTVLAKVEPEGFALVEFLVLCHLQLVIATQSNRRVPDAIAEISAAKIVEVTRSDEWEAQRARMVRELLAATAELLERSRERASNRDLEFVVWFEGLFPLLSSRLFCSEALADELRSFWKENVEPEYTDYARRSIADQAAQHLHSDVSIADIELLRSLGEDARATSLEGLRAQLQETDENDRATLLQLLEQHNVSARIVSSLREMGATRDVLLGLTAVNVRPEVIADIARLFPPQDAASAGEPRGADVVSG